MSSTVFYFSDAAPRITRTVLYQNGAPQWWYDGSADALGAQNYSASWKLADDSIPAGNLGSLTHVGQIHVTVPYIPVADMTPESHAAMVFERNVMGLAGLPFIPLAPHHSDDRKPKTTGTGGERRSLLYGLHLVNIIEDLKSAVAKTWSEEQAQRPYARRDPGTYPPYEGQTIEGYDGVARSIDDDQHMQFAHSFDAACRMVPAGWFALANGFQHWVHAWSMSQGSSERQKMHYFLLAGRCALLGFGEGIGTAWANEFTGGRSAKDWLLELLAAFYAGRNEFPFHGQYKDYKLPRLDTWPDVTTFIPTFDAGEQTTSDQPSNMGEYAWQWGMQLAGVWYALRVADHLNLTVPDRAGIEDYCEYGAQWIEATSRVNSSTGEAEIMGGCFYEWSSADADKLLAQYAIEKPNNWENINKHQVGPGRYILGRVWQTWRKEQAVWAATGAVLARDLKGSAQDPNMLQLLQECLDGGDYVERVDVMAPTITIGNLTVPS